MNAEDGEGRPTRFVFETQGARSSARSGDVEAIEPGGLVVLETSDASGRLRVEVRAGASGFAYTYTVNDEARPLDDEGRAWMRAGIARGAGLLGEPSDR